MATTPIIASIREKLESHYGKNSEGLAILDFIKVEILLYLFLRVTESRDAKKAYLLLSGLDRIGNKHIHSQYAYLLFCARIHLKKLRSQRIWEDMLAKYKKVQSKIRLFDFDDESGKVMLKVSDNIPYPGRKEAYWDYLNCLPEQRRHKVTFANVTEIYKFKNKEHNEAIQFSSNLITGTDCNAVKLNKKGGMIEVSLADLFKAAKEMDERLESGQFIEERTNWYQSMQRLIIKLVKGNHLSKCETIVIDKLCHIVGMVGAGKSTFMKVLTFWAVKNGYRSVLVLDSVAEVLKTVRFFEQIGLKVAPLLGRSPISRLAQVEKVVDDKAMFLDSTFSQYLTGVCPLDGLRNNTEDKALEYGTEPCERLEGENRTWFICPLYLSCPAKYAERKLINADIVITTPAGLIYGKMPFPLTGQKQHFIEYATQAFDLVVFDEADMVQANFDATFCPTLSVDELIAASGEPTKKHMEARGNRLKLDEEERRFHSELARLPDICDTVKELINNYDSVSDWGRIGNGNSFSAQVLLRQMSQDVEKHTYLSSIVENLLLAIDNLMQGSLAYIITKIKADSYDGEIDDLLRQWLNNLTPEKTLHVEKDWFIRIKFIIYLIVLEQRLRYISDYGVATGKEEIFNGPMRNRFQKLQDFLPASAVGNIFGFVYDKKNRTVKIFRQFAFGRALMLSLPYFYPTANGNFEGTNVLLLSGTSWARGATKYHIWVEVNYILENDDKNRQFIEESEVISIKGARVSSSGDKRPERLYQVIKDCVPYINKELDEKNDGRILFIVNSYPEAKQAQVFISSLYPNDKVWVMVNDDENYLDGSIRRKDIGLFFKKEARMLVAPAGSIERGHNIVDELGHSVFTSVFFLARPMSVPGDISEAITKINGKIEKWSNEISCVDDTFEYIKKLRSLAVKEWFKVLSSSYGHVGLINVKGQLQPDEDIVVSRLVIIHQVFGRLLRIVDLNRPRPTIYFADGAFEANEPEGFDLLKEILQWLEAQLSGNESAIVESLYGPFFRACKRGLHS